VNQSFRRCPGVAATLVMLLAGPACNVVGPGACTLIGCPGLVVEVTGAASQTPVTVVVTAPRIGTRYRLMWSIVLGQSQVRSTLAGSTLAARRAGAADATSATTSSTRGLRANAIGS
jgi:hypothetical protein